MGLSTLDNPAEEPHPAPMARADLLISLVRAGAAGDKALLRSTVEALAADERAKKHTVVAERLTRALNGAGQSQPFQMQAATAGSGKDFILEQEPRWTIEQLVLPTLVKQQVLEIVEEHHRADLLRSYGLQPRHRLLFSGPPGNGKTSLAEALAESLAVPFFTVRYDALIGSFLGETNQRLKRLFDYVRTTPCVLLFDEFDAVGKERGDVHETGEIKRLVSSLLLQVDALPSYVVIVAATNHQELLDRAVWRRFQMRVSLPAPTADQVLGVLRRALGAELKLDANLAAQVVGLELSSFAEAVDFVSDVRRRFVLSMGSASLNHTLRERVETWRQRLKVPNGERSNEAAIDVRSARRGPAHTRRSSSHSATSDG